MEPVIYLDTHVVAWLYAGAIDRISPYGAGLIRDNQIRISPIVRLELQYLYEIDRVKMPASEVVSSLQGEIGLAICDRPFALVVEAAEQLAWTRDPFDRLIVAQAGIGENPLLTKDEIIREHYRAAVW
jgi:PIN domain nuclease of toxin-antitoxin system